MKNITKLGLKIFSIYVFLIFINYFIQSISMLLYVLRANKIDILNISFGSYIIPALIFLLASIIIWMKADKLAAFLIKDEKIDNISIDFDYDKLQMITFSFLGLVLIVLSIPEIVKDSVRIVFFLSDNVNINYTIVSDLVGLFVKLILGLFLLIRSEGIIKIIKKAFSNLT